MPPVRPLSPAAIRSLLEQKGYTLIAGDDYNWAFAASLDDEPVIVPHAVDFVPLEVAMSVARRVGFNDYFEALHTEDATPPAPPE